MLLFYKSLFKYKKWNKSDWKQEKFVYIEFCIFMFFIRIFDEKTLDYFLSCTLWICQCCVSDTKICRDSDWFVLWWLCDLKHAVRYQWSLLLYERPLRSRCDNLMNSISSHSNGCLSSVSNSCADRFIYCYTLLQKEINSDFGNIICWWNCVQSVFCMSRNLCDQSILSFVFDLYRNNCLDLYLESSRIPPCIQINPWAQLRQRAPPLPISGSLA